MRFLGIAILSSVFLFMACEDPDPVPNDDLVNQPFVIEYDTIQFSGNLEAATDTINWNTFDLTHVGASDGFVSGFTMTFRYADSLWADSSLTSITLALYPVGAYSNDPTYVLAADSTVDSLRIPFVFYDASAISFDPVSNPGVEWKRESLLVKDSLSLAWSLDIDSTFMRSHDTVFTIGVATEADNSYLTTVYGPTSSIRPRIIFNHATPFLEPDSMGKDSLFSYVLLADSMNTVVVEKDGIFDSTNNYYLKNLTGEGFSFGVSIADWQNDVTRLRRISRSDFQLGAHLDSSSIYPLAASGTDRKINLRIADTESQLASVISLDDSLNALSGNLASIFQNALDSGHDSLHFTVLPSNPGDNPSYLTIPKSANPLIEILATISVVEVPQ